MKSKKFRLPELHWLHWCVFIASIILTLTVWYYSSTQTTQIKNDKINREANQVVSLLKERMQKYADALGSGVAFLAATNGPVTHREWKRFSRQLQIDLKYPGINGIGVIYLVPNIHLKAFEEEQRAAGNFYYTYPNHNAFIKMPIVFIEPMALNREAVGLDVAHETNRYNAAIRAIQTGKPSITGPITLVQDHKQTPGFLFYTPFYQHGSETIHEKPLGFVYAPFIVSKLMDGVLAKESRYVSFSISDNGESIFADSEVQDAIKSKIKPVKRSIEMYGRQWHVNIYPTPFFLKTLNSDLPDYILVIGFLFDFLLLYVFFMLARSRSKAIRYAKVLTEDLNRQAHEDFLTNLPNRFAFIKELEQLMGTESAPDFLLFFLDLDDFKNINDTLGHLVGDELLKAVADRLSVLTHENDKLMFSRLGGDEFAILVEGPLDDGQGEVLAQRVTQLMQETFNIGDHKFTMTFSIGIAYSKAQRGDRELPGEKVKKLLKKADIAMYDAKQRGKNCFVQYDEALHEKNERMRLIEVSLPAAIHDKAFHLEYQGIYDTHSKEKYGSEALLRWKHDPLGLVPPMSYIPIAERTGEINPLGDLVLNMAFAELAKHSHGKVGGSVVSVNCSTVQFVHPNFTSRLFELMGNHSVRPEQVILEVTETALMEDVDATLSVLNTIADRGVSLAIDDFGTGYSSLNYLDLLPVSYLKIDRSFTNRIGTPNSEIVANIVKLSHSSDFKVIAEGVETQAQIEYLQTIHCDYLQGFYFKDRE